MSETFLTDLQMDLARRLEADEYFATINVLIEDIQDIASIVERGLATLTAKATKLGAAVVVLSPEAGDALPNVTSGPLAADLSFLVLENRTINQGSSGTGLRALSIARRVHRIMKHYRAGGYAQHLVPFVPAIRPARDLLPLVAYEVRFTAQEGTPEVDLKVVMPAITAASGLATITCATAGASIYYTHATAAAFPNDSHPWSGNANSTLYSAPFAVASGDIIMAAAYLTDYIGSDVRYKEILASEVGASGDSITTDSGVGITTDDGVEIVLD